ncbi:DnaA N-terminal domain-containing protein, partial [Mycoplana ramosa]
MQTNTATSVGAFGNGDHALNAIAEGSDKPGDTSGTRHDALFERVSARLKAQVGQDVYASWFGRLKLHSQSKSVVRLSVPTTFLKSWINNRYLDLITSLFQQEDAEILKVEILVRTATRGARPGTEEVASASDAAPAAQPRR